VAGFGVVVTGIVSSAVIAFAGHVHTLVEIPEKLTMVVVAALALVIRQGVRESVMFAAAIAVLKVGHHDGALRVVGHHRGPCP
jgi:APA family basic amino acid/polyamine antiporter